LVLFPVKDLGCNHWQGVSFCGGSMPVCPMCKKEKPFEAFYPSPTKRNKRATYCKQCEKIYKETKRKKGIFKINHEKRKEDSIKYNLKYPQKKKSCQSLRNAISSGKIKKGRCEICGCINVHGHHDDYSNPLDVIWLCPKHHTWIHG
jgi:hypothetical protein